MILAPSRKWNVRDVQIIDAETRAWLRDFREPVEPCPAYSTSQMALGSVHQTRAIPMKTLASLFFIFIVGLGTTASAQQGPPTVTAAKPVVKTIVEDDEFVGRFEARSEVSLRSRVSGYLEEVHFREGGLVEAGQLLFTIDQRQFRTALRQAQAQIDVADATYAFATEQLERAQALIGNGTIPQSVLDERREAYLSAQGALEPGARGIGTGPVGP